MGHRVTLHGRQSVTKYVHDLTLEILIYRSRIGPENTAQESKLLSYVTPQAR
jgi:hypothetical protein